MVMDSQSGGVYDSVDGCNSYNGTMSSGPKESSNYANMSNFKDPSVILQTGAFSGNPTSSFSSGASPGGAGTPDDGDSDPVLKYISQVLMEEDMDEKPCMFHGTLTLQAAEKTFYDVLGEKYPPSHDQHPLTYHYVEIPGENFSGPSSDFHQHSCSSSTNTTSSVDSRWVLGSAQTPSFGSYDQLSTVSPWSLSSSLGGLDTATVNGVGGSNPSLPGGFNIFSHKESMIQFQRGVEEASKFLPKTSNLAINLDNVTFPEETNQGPSMAFKSDKKDYLPDGLRVRKFHYLDDNGDLERGRSSKQSAVSVEEAEDLSETFDKVLLFACKRSDSGCLVHQDLPNGEGQNFVQDIQPQGLDQGGEWYYRKQDDNKNVVDLRNLLILCAQATASDDRRTANELLKQIRQHSSPLGDGSERLAHYFANALEARFVGTGLQMYTALASKRISATQMLKAYQIFVSSSPFQKVGIVFSNYNILKVAEKRDKLHIIDFGILYGFKWPMLIQLLADRPEGPPLLRITGIELPLPGFKPAEGVEETGRRLAKYCERFRVPFEYHAIAQKWETIKVEDLKLEGDEVVAVSSLFRFRKLLDETTVVASPRNAVLNLIRKIKPDLFVHGIVNGSLSAPFFITRFKEALFHYSTLFDMFDTNTPREDPYRSMYEREFYGGEIMSIVACEGTERVERPETYKKWQVRNTKAGFTQLPLDPEIMKKVRNKVKCYHKDYSIDVDGNWTLMGWKGRITFATSAWIPS